MVHPPRSARIVALAAALAGASLATGCAGRREEVTWVSLPQPQSWIGRTEQEVVAVWGRPFEREPDGEGGTILSYPGERPAVSAEIHDPRTGRPVGNDGPLSEAVEGAGPVRPSAPPPVPQTPVAARFHLDAEGTVRRVWFSEELWRKGVPLPPRRE